jgi:hypothetical protein
MANIMEKFGFIDGMIHITFVDSKGNKTTCPFAINFGGNFQKNLEIKTVSYAIGTTEEFNCIRHGCGIRVMVMFSILSIMSAVMEGTFDRHIKLDCFLEIIKLFHSHISEIDIIGDFRDRVIAGSCYLDSFYTGVRPFHNLFLLFDRILKIFSHGNLSLDGVKTMCFTELEVFLVIINDIRELHSITSNTDVSNSASSTQDDEEMLTLKQKIIVLNNFQHPSCLLTQSADYIIKEKKLSYQRSLFLLFLIRKYCSHKDNFFTYFVSIFELLKIIKDIDCRFISQDLEQIMSSDNDILDRKYDCMKATEHYYDIFVSIFQRLLDGTSILTTRSDHPLCTAVNDDLFVKNFVQYRCADTGIRRDVEELLMLHILDFAYLNPEKLEPYFNRFKMFFPFLSLYDVDPECRIISFGQMMTYKPPEMFSFGNIKLFHLLPVIVSITLMYSNAEQAKYIRGLLTSIKVKIDKIRLTRNPTNGDVIKDVETITKYVLGTRVRNQDGRFVMLNAHRNYTSINTYYLSISLQEKYRTAYDIYLKK